MAAQFISRRTPSATGSCSCSDATAVEANRSSRLLSYIFEVLKFGLTPQVKEKVQIGASCRI